jgi:hypothetical protein
MRVLTLLLVALSVSTAGSEPNWAPDTATIGKLEATLQSSGIPARGLGKVRELSAYNRYYAGYLSGDQKMIEGEFIEPFGEKSKPTSVHIVGSRKELPRVFDGGCSIVHIVYSVGSDRIISARCNGIA